MPRRFPHRGRPRRAAAALADNRRAADEAATLGTDTLVLVSGGPPPGSKDLPGARERVADALAELAPYAEGNGVVLAIEPLHPLFASDRCVVSTLTQALDIAERFPAHQVGVTVDTYHVWWDDTAPAQVARAGAQGRIHTFQLADWTTPLPEGVLNGRGQIGDGAVDLREWRGHVEAAGCTGPIEVELFNEALWAREGGEVLAETAARFVEHTGQRPPEHAPTPVTAAVRGLVRAGRGASRAVPDRTPTFAGTARCFPPLPRSPCVHGPHRARHQHAFARPVNP